jgi:hypothetical protein
MNTQTIINIGTNIELLDKVIEVLTLAGHNRAEGIRIGARNYMRNGHPVSITVRDDFGMVTYARTSYYNEADEYKDTPRLILAKTIEPIRIGEHVAKVEEGGVRVGCTFVTWETIDKLRAQKK